MIITTSDQAVTFWILTETCKDNQFTLTSMMGQASYFWIQLPNEKRAWLYLTLRRKSSIPQWQTLPIRWRMTPASRLKQSVQTQALLWNQTRNSLKSSDSLRINWMRQPRYDKRRDFWAREIDYLTQLGDTESWVLRILWNLKVMFIWRNMRAISKSKEQKTPSTIKDRGLYLRKLSLLLKSTLVYQKTCNDLTHEALYQ